FKEFMKSFINTQPTEQIELILVAKKRNDYKNLIKVQFLSIKQIFIMDNESVGFALEKAVKLATSEIIIFFEDHVKILNGSFEDILKIYLKYNYASIGFIIIPSSMNSYINFVDYLISYSSFGPNTRIGERDEPIAGNNVIYSKSTLIRQDFNLSLLLESPYLLQKKILQDGERIYFSDKFLIEHYSIKSFSKLISEIYWISWLFAGIRQKIYNWSYTKRLLFSFALPIKPFVRLYFLFNYSTGSKYYNKKLLLKHILGIFSILTVGTIGEMLGHLFGIRKSRIKYTDSIMGMNRYENI
ncbi:hypothetical protein ACFLS9_08650, partial [Bacteroidota bacterium]